MTLDDIKQAAKRLRKQSPELAMTASSPLTHTQALDVVARLHGFRHYREAQTRLGNGAAAPALEASAGSKPQHKARSVLADTGGITLGGGLRFDFGTVHLSAKEPLTIEGPSGCGKSILTKELVCQALAQGTPVRILDTFGEYRHFTLALGGQYFGAPEAPDFQAAWNSDAPFVVLSAAAVYPLDTLFSHLRGLRADALFVCEDINPQVYQPLDVPTIRVKHRHNLMADGGWRGFRHTVNNGRGQWQIQLARSSGQVTASYVLSEARDEVWHQLSR